MPVKKKKSARKGDVTLPIEWHYPEDLKTRFANQMLVQFSDPEFYISFFEVRMPVITGDLQERNKRLQAMKTVPAECVSRVVISKERIGNFIETLQKNYETNVLKKVERKRTKKRAK